MANIVDPAAVKFANETVRRIADLRMQLYWAIKQARIEWTAKGLAALIPNDASPMIDGAVTDGRTQITGFDANAVLSHGDTYVTDMEASANLKINQIGKVAVNPLR